MNDKDVIKQAADLLDRASFELWLAGKNRLAIVPNLPHPVNAYLDSAKQGSMSILRQKKFWRYKEMLWTIAYEDLNETIGADWNDNGGDPDGWLWSRPLDDEYPEDAEVIAKARRAGMMVVPCIVLDVEKITSEVIRVARGIVDDKEEDAAIEAIEELFCLLSERLGWAYYASDYLVVVPLDRRFVWAGVGIPGLAGARIVRWDKERNYLLIWYGGHGIHVLDGALREIAFWNIGDFSQVDADEQEVIEAMEDCIANNRYEEFMV